MNKKNEAKLKAYLEANKMGSNPIPSDTKTHKDLNTNEAFKKPIKKKPRVST